MVGVRETVVGVETPHKNERPTPNVYRLARPVTDMASWFDRSIDRSIEDLRTLAFLSSTKCKQEEGVTKQPGSQSVSQSVSQAGSQAANRTTLLSLCIVVPASP
jgi:hypothetical protein